MRKDPEAGKLLMQRAHVLMAMEDLTGRSGSNLPATNRDTLSMRLDRAERAHLVHLTEANLQEFVAMTLHATRLGEQRDAMTVEREWTLPHERGHRVDIAIPSLRLALELKRYYRPPHPSAGRRKQRQAAEYVTQCHEQRARYQTVLGDAWDVRLVSPLASVPGSDSFSGALVGVLAACEGQVPKGE
eukprot:g2486.t1